MATQGVFAEWFKLADRQRTGMITGQDAVQFFSRSGLHKRLLAQVWEFADVNKRGCLSYEEFVNALRLIAFVQMTMASSASSPVGDPVNLQQAMVALSDASWPGVPALQGLSGSAPAPAQQQSVSASPGGVSGSGLSPQDVAKFKQAFHQLDTDKDGFLAGAECFPVFMKSGLDKQVLRQVWDLVAGYEGKLSERQFLVSQHLIAMARKGEALPSKLPPNFPGTGQPNGQSAFQGLGAAPGGGQPLPPQMMPPQPPPQQQTPPMQAPVSLPSPVMVSPLVGDFMYAPNTPPVPTNTDHMRKSEQLKLQEAQEKARKADEEKQRAVFDLMQAQKNKDMYRDAMQELVIFKSRADAELIQIGAQSRLEEQELEAAKKTYESLFARYGEAQEKYTSQHEALMALVAEKAKLAEEVQQMTTKSFDESEFEAPMQQVQSEIAVLRDQLMQINQTNMQKQMEKQNLEREKENYQAQIDQVQNLQKEIDQSIQSYKAEASALQKGADIDPKSKEDLSGCLNKCGRVFQALSQAALRCGVEIPSFQDLKLEWCESLASTAETWDMDELSQGFTVVENLGDLSLKTAAAATGADEAFFKSELPVSVALEDAKAGAPPPPLAKAASGSSGDQGSQVSLTGLVDGAGAGAQKEEESQEGGNVSQRSNFGTEALFGSGSNTFRSEETTPRAEDSPADAPPTEEAGSQKAAKAPLKEDWFSFDS